MSKTLTLGTVLSVESDTITQADITSITTPTTSTLVAASGSFVTLGVAEGDIVTISAHGAHAHNGPPLKVTVVAASTLTFEGTPLVVDVGADSAFSLSIYRPIGNLTNIETPGPTKGETEVTDYDSVAREFLGTLPDFGEVTFSGFMNEGNPGQTMAFTDAQDPDAPTRNWRIDFTRQDVRFAFAAWVKTFRYTGGGVDDAYGFDGTVRVTGAVTKSAIP